MTRAPVGMPQNRAGAAPSEDTLSGRGRARTRSECTLPAAAPTYRVPHEHAETHKIQGFQGRGRPDVGVRLFCTNAWQSSDSSDSACAASGQTA